MYKVLSGYDPLIVCPYHAAVYLRSAPYTGDKVIKTETKETETCKCCSVSKEQHEKALNTPKEEYVSLLEECYEGLEDAIAIGESRLIV